MTGPPPEGLNPLADLLANGPWTALTVCVDCGEEHRAVVLTKRTLERLERSLVPYGSCAGCIDAAGIADARLTNPRPEEEQVPTMEEVMAAFKDRPDEDDPFEGPYSPGAEQ